ncbi:MAG TPA: hypothetical protein VFA38_10630 [Nitrospirales bacterium]|nr:hypothetical protein [Nitrospirales bacterium]
MTDSKYHTPETGSLEGRSFRPATAEERAEAVERAFDFRGDVTIELRSGAVVEGYLFNREAHAPRPIVMIFPKDGGQLEIFYDDIASIAFTGKDTASGKSWEAWVTKKESQRRAETEAAEREARSRGHL